MRIAIIASNILPISKNTKKGTELFIYHFIENLAKFKNQLKITLFASGDSQVSVPLISVNKIGSFIDPKIGKTYHKIFELALIGKALEMQNQFDIFHVHIECGEVILPFAHFSKIPILITIHGDLTLPYKKDYFKIFSNLSNVYFIPCSNSQKKIIPFLNYLKTIYHGVDINLFNFSSKTENNLIWAGRGIPIKGLDIALETAKRTNKKIKIFPLKKEEYSNWLNTQIKKYQKQILKIEKNIEQIKLFSEIKNAKLFLFPIQWEEPFGLVMIESMATGTPVVAFARGSVPEVIKDGETGFIVNPSDDDIRGNWIVKKTGIEGLCEAVERIYSMPEKEYQEMRYNCRKHVEKYFTVERMVDEYIKVYQEVIEKNSF